VLLLLLLWLIWPFVDSYSRVRVSIHRDTHTGRPWTQRTSQERERAADQPL